MRLGEILVHEGQLTRQQLSQALRVQQLLGSRLGTTLLEESLITESALLETLGRQRSTRTASSSELTSVPADLVRMVPARLAARYGVVPFYLKGRTLSVASKDVTDMLKEDEIGFLTSCMVRTYIGLEFRIDEALERYYRIKIPDRHLALVRRFAAPGLSPPSPEASPETILQTSVPPSQASSAAVSPGLQLPLATAASSPTAHKPPALTPRVQPRFIELDDEDAALLGSSGEISAWTPKSEEPVLLKPSPLPWLARESAGAEAPPAEEAAASAAIQEVTEPVQPQTGSMETTQEPTSDLGLEERLHQAAVSFRDVEIRDDIADVLLAFCAPYFRRRIVLVTRKEHIVGWRGEGEGVESEKIRAIEIPARDPSVFLGLTGTSSFWLGSLPALDANQGLVDGLGGMAPKECVVLPVILRTRVVCYLYGDNLEGGVAGAPIAELRRLVAKAGLAFEIYILKNKLRML